jgi:hypothetical protein
VINRATIARQFQIPYRKTRLEPIKSVIDQFDRRLSERGGVHSRFDLEVPKVRRFLERALADGSIPVRGRKIDRTAIQRKFGFGNVMAFRRHTGMKKLLEEFDNALEAARRERGVAGLVRKFLEERDTEGNLPIERGVINRATIARQFNLPYDRTRVEPVKSVIDEFDHRLSERGYVRSKFDLEVPKVRCFLEKALADGSIPVRGKKVDRAAIRLKFGFDESTLTRHKELRKLLVEFDRSLSAAQFKWSKYEVYTEPLRALLTNMIGGGTDPLPMHQGRLSRAVIARKLNVPAYALSRPSKLQDILIEADRQIAGMVKPFWTTSRDGRVELVRPGLAPWVSRHGRHYDFNELADIYSENVAIRVRDAFLKYCTKYASGTARIRYASTLRLLRWLSRSPIAGPRIVATLRNGDKPDADLFEQACGAWRAEQVSDLRGRKETTVSGIIHTVNLVVRYLALAGIVPRIKSLKPIAGAKRKTKPRRSFAEVSRRLREVAHDALHRIAQAREIIVPASEENAFLRALEEEAYLRDDLPEDTVSAIRVLLSDRLAALRKCAEEDFLKWQRLWDEGKSLIDNVDGQSTASARLTTFGGPQKHVTVSAELDHFLAAVDDQFNGCAPRRNFHRGLAHVYAKNGGFAAVEYRLSPHPEAVIAAVIMYLHDSGANVSTARTLDFDCIEPSPVPGYERITGFKARSKGKPIITDLPVKSAHQQITTIAALKKLVEMTSRYRRNASERDKRSLFLVRPQSTVVALSGHQLLAWFKQFCGRHKELKDFQFRPSMIRPSVLLELALNREGNLIAAQYKAQHASPATTSRSYVHKYPMLLLYEEKMKLFMNQFQATATAPIAGAAQRLGISVEAARELLKEAERNGLGVLCLLPRAGIQPETREGDLCRFPERCINCSASIVVPQPEMIADMLIFNESLRKEHDRFAAERNERWEQVWLQWLAFTDVVLEGMTRGPQAKILAHARAIVEQRKADPAFQPMSPW